MADLAAVFNCPTNQLEETRSNFAQRCTREGMRSNDHRWERGKFQEIKRKKKTNKTTTTMKLVCTRVWMQIGCGIYIA